MSSSIYIPAQIEQPSGRTNIRMIDPEHHLLELGVRRPPSTFRSSFRNDKQSRRTIASGPTGPDESCPN